MKVLDSKAALWKLYLGAIPIYLKVYSSILFHIVAIEFLMPPALVATLPFVQNIYVHVIMFS